MKNLGSAYDNLVELLSFRVNQAPEVEVLYNAAFREITDLREKLCQQSKMLAEALKLKNDSESRCIERGTQIAVLELDLGHQKRLFKSVQDANAALVESEAKLKGSLLENEANAGSYKWLGERYNCVGYVDKFIQSLQTQITDLNAQLDHAKVDGITFKTTADNAGKLLSNSMRQVVELQNELFRLRPSEPLFRVGQVLVLVDCGNAFYVRHQRRNAFSALWEYSNRKCIPGPLDWTEESKLRCLTDAEK